MKMINFIYIYIISLIIFQPFVNELEYGKNSIQLKNCFSRLIKYYLFNEKEMKD